MDSASEFLNPLSVDSRYAKICSAATLQSEPKGFFGELVNTLEATVGTKWLAKLGELSSDEDRIRFCHNRKEVRDALQGVQPVYREKDANLSARLILESTSALKRGDQAAALPLLNRAAVKAPAGSALAAVLWTRSGALIAAGSWEAGKSDAESALSQGLPDDRRAEAFLRIGRCHLALGDAARAKISLQLGKRLAGDAGNSAMRKAAEKALKKLEVADATTSATPDGLFDDSRLGKGSSVPAVDDPPLTVTSSPGAGRFLAAARRISPGETILVEKPLAVVPLPDRAGSRCHHCLARLETARGCSRCSGVAFCSPKCCKTAEETYHKTECRFLGLLEGAGASALTCLALRLATQQPLKFFQQLKIKQTDSESDQDSSAYRKIVCLEGHDQLRPNSELFHRTVMALLLLKILQQSSYFNQPPKPGELSADEAMMGGLLLRLLLVLQFNAHEVFETLLPPTGVRRGRPLPLAVAAYPKASLFNHSCYPNVNRYYIGTTLVIASMRSLEKGCMAADSYGALFSRQALGERRRWLASRYWFVCSCKACLGAWPMSCDLNDDDFAQIARSLIRTAETAMDQEDINKASAILTDLLQRITDSDSSPRKWIIEAQMALRACLTARGNVHRLTSIPMITEIDLSAARLAIT